MAFERVHQTSLTSFNQNHSLYDQVRPSFDTPFTAQFLKDLGLNQTDTSDDGDRKTVLELAVGTGKFSREFINRGLDKHHDLIFVEPSEGMLETFQKNFPKLNSKLGSSYKLPIDDDSVDVIIIAQAFHWFADDDSIQELNRVLKRGGKLGLIWNFDTIDNNLSLQNERVHFNIDAKDLKETATWQRIAESAQKFDQGVPQFRKAEWKSVFEQNPSKDFDYSNSIEKTTYLSFPFETDKVYGYWLSRSFITSLPDAAKAKLQDEIQNAIKTAPAEAFVDSNHIKQLLGTHYFIIPVIK